MNYKNQVPSYGRFKSLPWFDEMSTSTILVGGAGGIGSWVSLFLARIGCNVLTIDMDTVGEENLAGQTYGKEDIDKTKVTALENVIVRLCGENNFTPINEEVTSEGGYWSARLPTCNVVVVGFDNLDARRIVYEEWKQNGMENSLFIDGRLAAESGQIFLLEKNSSEEVFKGYEATYFPVELRTELPCTMKATTHCGALIGSMIITQITNWFTNKKETIFPREVGNFEFHLPFLLFSQPKFEEYV